MDKKAKAKEDVQNLELMFNEKSYQNGPKLSFKTIIPDIYI